MPIKKVHIFRHTFLLKRSVIQVLGLVLLCLVCFSCTSNVDTNKVNTSPLLDSAREHAIVMAEAGNTEKAFRFLDSVYKRYPNVSTVDKYEYLYFFHDRYYRIKDFVDGDRYIDSMFLLLQNSGDTDVLISQYAKVNFSRADRLFEQGDYNQAYSYYYKAKTIAEKGSDSCTRGYYNYKIGLVLYRGERYNEAISFFQEAYRQIGVCYDDLPYFLRLQEILDDIGLSYYHLKKADSALLYYHKSLDLIKEGRGNFPANKFKSFESAMAVVYGNMGSTYLDQGNDMMAELVMNHSIDINSQKGYDFVDAQFTRIKLAALYFKQNRIEECFAMLTEVRRQQETTANTNGNVEMRWNNLMWRYLRLKGQEETAFPYLLTYVKLKDSIDQVNSQVLHIDIEERVDNIAKASTISDLERKEELRSIYLVIAFVFCIMSVAIIVLIFQNSRKSKRNIKVLTGLNTKMNEQQQRLQQVLDTLEKSDKEKDRILKAVSHDMRSPVNSALALTELVLLDDSISPEQKEYLELIKKTSTNALNLTKDLLEVATLHSEKIKKEHVDIKELLAVNVELLRFRAADKKQNIELVVPEPPVFIIINAEKIVRVIHNIVANAIKFSPIYSVIQISLETPAGGVIIVIKDSGIGIPASMQDRVFDIFTEAKRFGTSGEEPYGLGLSISKQIVEVHGGKIWFESEVGQGTTFYIYLPGNNSKV